MNREIFAYGASLAVVLAAVVAGHYVYDPGLSAFAKGLAPGVIAFFQAITHLGVATWSLVGSALLAVYFHFIARNRILAGRMMYLFASVAGSGLVVDAIKWLAGRWRPNAFAHRGLYGFELFGFGYDQTSFPSGHAATICSMAVALAVLYPRFRWVWGAVAVLVCVSRVVIRRPLSQRRDHGCLCWHFCRVSAKEGAHIQKGK